MNNYPPGAEFDPNAPYNQYEPDSVNVDVCISTTLSKSTTISTSDYEVEEWEDCETDVDGSCIKTGGTVYDFSHSDLNNAYKDTEFTIPQLLDILKKYIIEDLENNGASSYTRRKQRLLCILKSCEGWKEDELEVIEE